ncbi:hypothetical protein RJT34_05827 [Clitoria ternatea]|uniref:Uncharacterized protein n=1 Tax=Clitoria ternatea TaxID=43366 RepID=A0AAN9K1J3_CLITE
MIHPLTSEVISYQEFARFRQRYLVMYCPFKDFERKEEKSCTKRKITNWLNPIIKLKKKHMIKNKQEKARNSPNSSSLDSSAHFGNSLLRYLGCIGGNSNVYHHCPKSV